MNECLGNIFRRTKQGDLKGAFWSACKFLEIVQAILGECNHEALLLSMGTVVQLLESAELENLVKKSQVLRFCKALKENARVCVGDSCPFFMRYERLERFYSGKCR